MVSHGRMVNGTWYPTSTNSGAMRGNFVGMESMPQDMSFGGFPGPYPPFTAPYGYGMPQNWMMNGGSGSPMGGESNNMFMGGMGGMNNSTPPQGMMNNCDTGMMPPNAQMMMYMQMQQYMQQMQNSQSVGGNGVVDGENFPMHNMQQPGYPPHHLNQQVPPPNTTQPPANYRPGTFLESDIIHMHAPADPVINTNEGLPEVLRQLSLSPSRSELSNTSTVAQVMSMSAPMSEASCSSLGSCEADYVTPQGVNDENNRKENVSQQQMPANYFTGDFSSPEKLEREKDVDERIRLIREKNARAEQKRMLALAEADNVSEDGSTTNSTGAPAVAREPRFGKQQPNNQQRRHSRDGNNNFSSSWSNSVSNNTKPMRGGMGRGGAKGGGYVPGGRGGPRVGGPRSINDGRMGVQKAMEKGEQDDGWHTVISRSNSKNRMQRAGAPVTASG